MAGRSLAVPISLLAAFPALSLSGRSCTIFLVSKGFPLLLPTSTADLGGIRSMTYVKTAAQENSPRTRQDNPVRPVASRRLQVAWASTWELRQRCLDTRGRSRPVIRVSYWKYPFFREPKHFNEPSNVQPVSALRQFQEFREPHLEFVSVLPRGVPTGIGATEIVVFITRRVVNRVPIELLGHCAVICEDVGFDSYAAPPIQTRGSHAGTDPKVLISSLRELVDHAQNSRAAPLRL